MYDGMVTLVADGRPLDLVNIILASVKHCFVRSSQLTDGASSQAGCHCDLIASKVVIVEEKRCWRFPNARLKLCSSAFIDAMVYRTLFNHLSIIFAPKASTYSMSELINGEGSGQKRKRGSEKEGKKISKRRAIASDATDDEDPQAQILLLENQILDSRRNYNNIANLLAILKHSNPQEEVVIYVAFALCRVFVRLAAAGNLSKTKDAPENEIVIVDWLKERHKEFSEALLRLLEDNHPAKQSTALKLLLRLFKDEGMYTSPGEDRIWKSGIFTKLIGILIGPKAAQHVREEFVEKYVKEYDDIRYYTFTNIA